MSRLFTKMSDQSISIADDSELQQSDEMTVSIWMLPTSIANNNGERLATRQIGFGTDSETEFVLGFSDTPAIPLFGWYFNASFVTSGIRQVRINEGSRVTADVWYHVCGGYRRSSNEVFLVVYNHGDGSEQIVTGAGFPTESLTQISGSLRLGAFEGDPTAVDAQFNGRLAQLQYWPNQSLSLSQIRHIRWRPQNFLRPVINMPLWGTDSPEPNFAGSGADSSHSGTLTNTPTQAGNPPIMANLGGLVPAELDQGIGAGDPVLADQFEFYESRIQFDASEVPPNATVHFEADLKRVAGTQDAKARLYDETAGEAVSGSEINTTAVEYQLQRSSALSLVAGDRIYRAQVGSQAGKTTGIRGARLVVIPGA